MNWRLAGSIMGCVLLSSCGTASMRLAPPQSQDPSRFAYTRLYCTPDDESHFETVTVDLAKVDGAPPRRLPLSRQIRLPARFWQGSIRAGARMTCKLASFTRRPRLSSLSTFRASCQ
jgi:hypothetical protein